MDSKLNNPCSFEVAELLWTLGLLKEGQLPSIGVQALIEGYDCPALRLLAGLNPSDKADHWFCVSLQELGHAKMTKLEAARRYARIIAKDIAEGRTAPYDGAREIWRASLQIKKRAHTSLTNSSMRRANTKVARTTGNIFREKF